MPLRPWDQGDLTPEHFQNESQRWREWLLFLPISSCSHLVFLYCFLPSQKEDVVHSRCCLSPSWFCQLSFLCVHQNVLLIHSPSSLFCSLFLILKIVLLVLLFTCFPMPSECSCASLCLPSLEVTLLTSLCKTLIHCAWRCNHSITKYVCCSIFICL